MDFVQDVEKLADLRDKGILTEEEFQTKKAELLARPHNSAADEPAPASQSAGGRSLDVAEKMLIEQKVANEKPSQTLAYILWFFTWPVGGHRFYLGKTGSAILMLILSITIVGLVITGPWAIIDLFLIPGMVQQKIDVIRDRYTLRSI